MQRLLELARFGGDADAVGSRDAGAAPTMTLKASSSNRAPAPAHVHAGETLRKSGSGCCISGECNVFAISSSRFRGSIPRDRAAAARIDEVAAHERCPFGGINTPVSVFRARSRAIHARANARLSRGGALSRWDLARGRVFWGFRRPRVATTRDRATVPRAEPADIALILPDRSYPIVADPTAPLYSKLGSREGFAHWTTSHLPPRKKLEGKGANGVRFPPYGAFDEHKRESEGGFESPRKEHRRDGPGARFSRLLSRLHERVSAGGGGGGPKPPQSKFARAGASFVRGVGGGASRIGCAAGNAAKRARDGIRNIISPLQMLKIVTVLFLNMTWSVTTETLSIPRNVYVVGKLLWPSLLARFASEVESPKKKRRRERREARERAMPKINLERAKQRIVGLGKNSKRLSGFLVGGVRRKILETGEHMNDHRRVDFLVKEGQRCNAVCDSEGATEAFRAAVAIRPNDHELLVSLSKCLSDRVFEETVFHNAPLARAISNEAADISKRAISIRPNHAEAHVCLGAALGRLAMWCDNRQKVDLSRSIKECCEEAIRLDASNDLAMHVLARFHHQMANLGKVVRVLVRVVYGGALEPGTLEEAEALFRRAIAIKPERLIHRVELGKLLLDLGRAEEAKAELVLAVGLPREDINSEHERRDAVGLLKKHWEIEATTPAFEDPPPTPPPRRCQKSGEFARDADGHLVIRSPAKSLRFEQ